MWPVKVSVVTTVYELEQCFAIRKQVFVQEQQVPEELEMDEYDASPEAAVHVLAVSEGEPVGTGRFKAYDESTAKLQRIAVLGSKRGAGFGRLVIEALENEAKSRGFAACVLDAQVQAEGFYKRLGYETVSSETFLDAGIPHVRMMKKLG
ncbi:GNAT family N-acetyltransferase [Paenibacillus turpanensis]|uniref:GNAT family N-acetyltransferase n=1 Tax=Paenibacillus turpanensis TaxID=2689078 RepID=UPI00140C4C95|nr:GNAT family N-acetyltransferase [Paenibacillus turpanensis]